MPVAPTPPLSPPAPSIADRLLAHYDAHARTLPWRIRPGSTQQPDPYRVWLSEIMLQQTTVAAVIPYFDTFTRRWPTVDALADAADADVMAAWAGLGYYARARNLLACARVVAGEQRGRFPDSEAGLRALPGVGAYTAAAIAAIAFGQRAVVVDANVERVVARLFAIGTPLPAARPAIRTAADSITPNERAGDFAQAMMDLGSSLCTPRNPQCLLCPLRSDCRAAQSGDPAAYPVKPAKGEKPRRTGTVWWLERDDGQVWIEQRPAKRMLGGMRGLPGTDWDSRTSWQQTAPPPLAGPWQALNSPVEHVFSHFALTLTVERLRVAQQSDCLPGGDGEWWPLASLADAGLPGVFAKVARLALRENA
ncbi:A/G-specific adenine glycosylase [Sphingobium subterraneum]|uniref:Adenine DNA glycosylase n=1 Tax=Sphingobium subterraneum TaxID=627688 RepID=A0A841J6N0_9SPHN|nr:A/G-specific adenine glycosylase [Sphingobium subterraneum]